MCRAELPTTHILSMDTQTGGAEGKGRFASFGMAIGKGLWQGVVSPLPPWPDF